jgi:hypothetical protein
MFPATCEAHDIDNALAGVKTSHPLLPVIKTLINQRPLRKVKEDFAVICDHANA